MSQHCEHMRAAKTAPNALRVVKLCQLRCDGGFMVKHWKCLGREDPGCPLNQTCKMCGGQHGEGLACPQLTPMAGA